MYRIYENMLSLNYKRIIAFVGTSGYVTPAIMTSMRVKMAHKEETET